jgi:hypothetical protein
MISSKFIHETKEKRERTGKQYADWILLHPEGVTVAQVTEHFKKKDKNTVRGLLQKTPNIYVSHWTRNSKNLPQAIFKAVREGEPVPETVKNLNSIHAMDVRLSNAGYIRQGLTVIRGPWPSTTGVTA